MIWQISIWENCLLFSQWIWSKNEKSFTLSTKLFKRKKICTFLPRNNGVGIKLEKSVTNLSSIKSSAILRKKEKKETMWRISPSGQIYYRVLIVGSRWSEHVYLAVSECATTEYSWNSREGGQRASVSLFSETGSNWFWWEYCHMDWKSAERW